MRTAANILALSLALLACTAGATASAESNTPPPRRERDSKFIVGEGDYAPTFQIVTNDGDTIDSDMLRGQVVVLQFAASWCPFSQAQVVDHQEVIFDKYKSDANFAMILICEDVEEDRPTFVSQREERGISIPYTFDSGERIYRLFVTPNGSVTRTVVIGPDWRIAELRDMHTWGGMRSIRRCVGRLLRKMGR